jgi:hypothetical protein
VNTPSTSARSILSFIVLALTSLARPAPAQQYTPGAPWTGEPGTTQTVAQIMERERQNPDAGALYAPLPFRTIDRTALPQDPSSVDSPSWPASGQIEPAFGPRSPQLPGASWAAATLGPDSNAIPPDSMGDVSPTQVLVCVNGRIKVFSKTGVLGGLNATTATFFNSVRNGAGTSDPRVVWDRLTNRWFLAMITTSTPNRVMIAVSSGPTITSASSFTFFQFQQDLVGVAPNADTGGLADYPSLGVDTNALYIGANIFNPGFTGTSGWVVRKSDLLAGTLTVTAFRQLATGAGAGPFSPRGVTNDDPAAAEGYFIGTNTAAFGSLVVRRVLNPGATPSISSNILIPTLSTANPILVPARNSTVGIDSGDDRIYDARILKNRTNGVRTLWTSHTIQVNASGAASNTGGRDAARWYQIQNLTGTPTVLQSGTLFDSSAASPRFFFYPTIAMSAQGHAALSCTAAGQNEFPEIVAAGRFSSDAAGTIQAPTITQSSSTPYTQVGGGRNRWGDFSSTVVDPADDMTIWTFQEYCSNTNIWSVRAMSLLAPPPATPASCAPSSLAQGASNIDVVVTGTSSAGSGFFDPDAALPNHIHASVAGAGVTVNRVTWTDPTHVTLNLSVAPGALSGPRAITITNPDGQAASSAAGLLTINPASHCGSADFNCDGDVGTDADIEAFFACIAGNCPAPPCTSTADFNADGDSGTDADIEAFFRVIAGGAC